jgi:formylglycine-generating enzyme required for sulfatase activity
MKKVYKQNSSRVKRGGGWSGNASALRAADRYSGSPSYQYNYIGARSAKKVKYEKSI